VVGYLLDGHLLAATQQGLGLDDDVVIDPMQGIDAGMLLDDRRKVLGCQTE